MDYPSCRWNIHGISKIVGAMSHWSSSVEGYLRFVMCFATLFDFRGCFFPDGLLKPMRRFQLTREIRRGDDIVDENDVLRQVLQPRGGWKSLNQ